MVGVFESPCDACGFDEQNEALHRSALPGGNVKVHRNDDALIGEQKKIERRLALLALRSERGKSAFCRPRHRITSIGSGRAIFPNSFGCAHQKVG
jgi:hypothetical protein